jgi:D-3-phosphoglycerate dehydrogenase
VRVLFLGNPDMLQPGYDDFLTAIGGRYPIVLYDPARPLADQFAGIDAVVEQSAGTGTRAMIDAAAAAGVKLWQIFTTGLDRVDVAYFLQKGIPLANTPGQFSSIALAEHALFLMLCLAKNLRASQQNVRSGVFYQATNDELEGKNLGLIGLGASGRELARRAWPMGMRIMAVDIADIPPAVRGELHVEFFGDPSRLDEMLAQADYVSIHVPLNPETRHMIDRRAFAIMKPGAVLINVARGDIVDEAALIEALQTGQIRGAGLDVFAREPLDPAHPLLQLENVVATPHVAAGTTGTSRRRAQVAAENIVRIAQGMSPLFQITSVP